MRTAMTEAGREGAAGMGRTRPRAAPQSGQRQAVKSALRAFALLEAFGQAGGSLSVGEVCRLLEMPQSSASILLRELAAAGYLHQDPDSRRYLPSLHTGLTVARLDRPAAPGCAAGHAVVLQTATRLAAETGEEIMVAVRQGIDLKYIHRERARLPFFGDHPPGALRPLARTSMGKALLSTLDDATAGRVIRRANLERPEWSVSAEATLPQIRRARAECHAMAFEEATPGTAGVSALLRGVNGQTVAFGICGPADRIRQRRRVLTRQLHAALDDAGARLLPDA